MPWLGASARRTLRGTRVRNTVSPKCWVSSLLTALARLLRTSYMVRMMPSISSAGLSFCFSALMVLISELRPSSAKYSHCIGTMMPSAAAKAFRVSSDSDGGQSMMMKS